MPSANDGLPPSGPALQRAFEALVSIFNERDVAYAGNLGFESFTDDGDPGRAQFEQWEAVRALKLIDEASVMRVRLP